MAGWWGSGTPLWEEQTLTPPAAPWATRLQGRLTWLWGALCLGGLVCDTGKALLGVPQVPLPPPWGRLALPQAAGAAEVESRCLGTTWSTLPPAEWGPEPLVLEEGKHVTQLRRGFSATPGKEGAFAWEQA